MTTTRKRNPVQPAFTFSVDDGATLCMWSDRHAGTVVEVSTDGKTVTWQEDTAKRTDARGMSDAQSYEYSRNPQGMIRVFSLRSNGRWVQRGSSMNDGNCLVPGRSEYYDYSF